MSSLTPLSGLANYDKSDRDGRKLAQGECQFGPIPERLVRRAKGRIAAVPRSFGDTVEPFGRNEWPRA